MNLSITIQWLEKTHDVVCYTAVHFGIFLFIVTRGPSFSPDAHRHTTMLPSVMSPVSPSWLKLS